MNLILDILAIFQELELLDPKATRHSQCNRVAALLRMA